MTLKKATLIALIGLCLILIFRTSYTLFLKMGWSPIFARISTILGIFCTASLLLFAIYFYREYLTKDTGRLRLPTIFLIITISIILFLRIKGVLQVLPKLHTPVYEISPVLYGFLMDNSIGYYSPMISGIYALSLLVFFSTLNGVVFESKSPQLSTATRWALFGSILYFLLCTINILIFYFFRPANWIENLSPKFSIFIFPLFLLPLLTFLYFIWIFYKSLGHTNNL